MVKGLYYSGLNNANLSGCACRSIEAVEESNIPGITELDKFITLKTVFAQFDASLTRKRGSVFTKKYNECAATLTKTCTGFKTCVKNMTNSPNSTICEHGNLLLSSLNAFDYNLSDKQGPTLAPYARNIVREFKKPEYAQSLKSDPMLSSWLSDIETALTAFNEAANLKDNNLLSNNNLDCATKLREPLSEAMNTFYLHVMGMMLTTNSEDWTTLHDILTDRYKKASRTISSTTASTTDTTANESTTDNTANKG
ncbi:MAG: DUF6261 family protein [Bacteroidota bacterium]|nr:DUF6261 family protein [Bacteroidota bacterium]